MNKKRNVIVLTKKNEIKKAEKFLNDGYQTEWEKGKLGRDMRHAVGDSAENASGAPTTIRLPKSLKKTIATMAKENGLTLNSYIRMILIEYAKQKNKKHAA